MLDINTEIGIYFKWIRCIAGSTSYWGNCPDVIIEKREIQGKFRLINVVNILTIVVENMCLKIKFMCEYVISIHK